MVTTTSANAWIAFRRPNPQARLRLFCFPFAGGGASIYRTWQNSLPREIEVCAVQLPGRESRLRDEPFRRLGPLIEKLIEVLAPEDELPFAFFGHSMGAIIAYHLTLRLRELKKPMPSMLLVSGRRAPFLPPEDDDVIYHLPDDEFKDKLRELDGTPETVLEHPELMELMLPLLRADFELVDTSETVTAEPLEMPVVAFGGLRDEEVQKEKLEAWTEVTRGSFRLRMFPGGHFFIQEDRNSLLGAVAEDLLRSMPLR